MCVVSMVHDHYNPLFPPWIPDTTAPSIQPIGPVGPVVQPNNVPISMAPIFDALAAKEVVDDLRKLISEFKEAMAAAKKVDILTGQPDCLDPAKAGLEERVAKLEAVLNKLSRRKRNCVKKKK